MKTGTVNLPLHGGKAPAWLFSRMVKLSREILLVMSSEYGPPEIFKRISDPLWFQALGCVLGFDWHSSGVTTTVCGALKEASKGVEGYTGLYITGGKGATSRKTPAEIESVQEKKGTDLAGLVYSSKMSAKVDSNALQDGYQLYHHCFFFTPDGKNWAVVQQGMNQENRMARRYHWLGSNVSDFVCEPHSAICCDSKQDVLNLVDRQSGQARATIAELASEYPGKVLKDLKTIRNIYTGGRTFYKTPLLTDNPGAAPFETTEEFIGDRTSDNTTYTLPKRHDIYPEDIDEKRFEKILLSTYEKKPENFEKLLAIPGVGPRTIRSLAMISELIYGVKYSIKDPVRFSFAHGGKDGIPYPVDRENYDRSIEILHRAVNESRIDRSEKINAIKRLSWFYKLQ
ncbi:MAG: DUF763 domain-containing protein [Actinobacteria bacterium]|nr:DUF763 domain-containing protein [Actinomycetota bacterium]